MKITNVDCCKKLLTSRDLVQGRVYRIVRGSLNGNNGELVMPVSSYGGVGSDLMLRLSDGSYFKRHSESCKYEEVVAELVVKGTL